MPGSSFVLDTSTLDAGQYVYYCTIHPWMVGTFTVGLTPIPDYPPHYFAPVAPALYLNRLAIDPSLQRRGLGRACMAQIESIARAQGGGGHRRAGLGRDGESD